MHSKKTALHVCLPTGLAMVLRIAGPCSGQNSSTATEAPWTAIVKSNLPTLGLLARNLCLRQVHAHPSTYNLRDKPFGRSVCAL
jgi:hypothetical protein